MVEPKEFQIEMVGYCCYADFYDNGNPKQTILFLVGYTSNKKKYENLASRVVKKTGMNAVVLDYSGHGKSPFELETLSQSINFEESVKAFDWIKGNYPESDIFVVGTSYGGYMGSLLAGYRDIKKLLLRVPGAYDWSWFYTPWNKLPDENDRRRHRQSPDLVSENPILQEASRNFKNPVMVLTHELDDICPKVSTDAFAELFNADGWEAKGFYHGFSESNPTPEQMEEYQTVMSDWIKK